MSEAESMFHLLALNPQSQEERKKLDSDAIIRAVQLNPFSAQVTYKFPYNDYRHFPLHQAIMLRSPVSVINALCSSNAMRCKCVGGNALHYASSNQASLDVILLLLKKLPVEAAREKDRHGHTPLHLACSNRATLNVVSLLLEYWPESIKETDENGYTSLHTACEYGAPLDIVSFLLDNWAGATKEKDNWGFTPLHTACRYAASSDVV
eukprot:3872041-Ditylum_brightwellii.AAC.1